MENSLNGALSYSEFSPANGVRKVKKIKDYYKISLIYVNLKLIHTMGKKIKYVDPEDGEIITVDEDNCYITTYAELVKSGSLGRKEQYKYFCEHPEEIEDQKLFSELEEGFRDDNT